MCKYHIVIKNNFWFFCFSEQYNQNDNGKRSWLNLGCLMPQNSVVNLNSSSQPHYTGL